MAISTGMSELCDGLSWRLQMMQNPEYSSKYTLGEALGDLTVVGTLYNMGGAVAQLQRADRSVEWLRGIQQARKPHNEQACALVEKSRDIFAGEKRSLQKSIATKVAYLGSLGMILVGELYSFPYLRNAGIAGSFGLGSYFMLKAGVDSNDRALRERICFLEEQCQDLASQVAN